MRNIKAKFKKEELKNQNCGAFINLARAVRGQKFSRQNLVKTFNEVMPDEEYAKDERKGLINFLESVTNMLEENENGVKNALESTLKTKDDKQLI